MGKHNKTTKPPKWIQRASECVLDKFMRCNFDNDLSVLIISGKPAPEDLLAAWDNILTEYIDLSGQYKDMEEMELMRRMKYLECRNEAVEKTVTGQIAAVEHLGEPMVEYLDVLEQNGYPLTWTGDKQEFLDRLNGIRTAEASYKEEYNDTCAELEQYYKARQDEDKNLLNNRRKFLSMVNSIERFWSKIDMFTLSVERFAIMVSDYREMIGRKAIESSKN